MADRRARGPGTSSWRWAALVVLLAAAALRLWRLADVPPGFQFDEAHNAIDATRVLGGDLRLFFADNGGREPLAIYLHALPIGLLGPVNAALALRLVSAFAGILTVALLCGFVNGLAASRRLAVLAAGFLAVSYWHVHFSRYGIRAILAPVWAVAAIWAWWAALGPVGSGRPSGVPERRPTAGIAAPILAGSFLALAVYSHPSGRLLPIVIAGHALYRIATDRPGARLVWRNLGVTALAAIVVFAPLGFYFLGHPGQFWAHPSDVSLSAVADAQHGGSLARALGANLAAIAGMLFVAGDPSALHNLPGLPVFDPISAVLAVAGFGVAVAWLVGGRPQPRDRAVLLLLWLTVGLLPTVLSDRPPNYSRAIAALPVIVMLPALGLHWPLYVARPWPARARAAAAGLVLTTAGAWTAYHYFVSFPAHPGVFYSYDQDKREAVEALASMAASANVFLHPVWAEQATVAFLDDGSIGSLDGHDTLVIRADRRDTVMAFPEHAAERQEWYDKAKSLYGHAAARERITDTLGSTLLRVLRVPATASGDLRPPRDAPLEPEVFDGALFGDAIRLVGHSLGVARPGEPLDVVLVWSAERPIDRDLTVFVHLLGPDGQPWGQDDREPAHATYRTSRWQRGDVIIDRYRPVLDASASGITAVEVGWYDGATLRRLPVQNGTDAAVLGAVPVLPPSTD